MEYAAVRLQLRRLLAKQRRANMAPSWSTFSRNVAILLYHKSASCDAAVAFLEKRAAVHNIPAQPLEDLRLLVEDWFLETDMEAMLALDSEWDTGTSSVARFARQWLDKWNLSVWIHTQNQRLGVAPTTARVVAQRDAFRESLAAPQPSSGRLFSVLRKYDTVWASRFRQRFRLRHMRMRIRENIPLAILRRKAVLPVPVFPVF